MPPFGTRRTHHLHASEQDDDVARRLLFRDYLRGNPDEAARYATLKRELAERRGADREGYTAAKAPFIAAAVARAGGS